MPWIQVNENSNREVWLRTEAVIGLAIPERHSSGTRLLLLSGTSLEVTEPRDELLQKIKEAEGTAQRDRRVGFPGE
ncbi:MAG TPA: hypothetical protein VHC97_01575 [Thermoanaerobaculia bacterium]|jgi:hypothetical protein|nr:hypothetical protein [Thermoanaerobaculia bacterium]